MSSSGFLGIIPIMQHTTQQDNPVKLSGIGRSVALDDRMIARCAASSVARAGSRPTAHVVSVASSKVTIVGTIT